MSVCAPRRSTQRALCGHCACLHAAPRPCSRRAGLAPNREASIRPVKALPAHLCSTTLVVGSFAVPGLCLSVRLGCLSSLTGRRATHSRSGYSTSQGVAAQRQLSPVSYGDRYTTACKQRTSTASHLVENMMSIKSFVEIKESAAAPCYPSVLSLSAPSQ